MKKGPYGPFSCPCHSLQHSLPNNNYICDQIKREEENGKILETAQGALPGDFTTGSPGGYFTTGSNNGGTGRQHYDWAFGRHRTGHRGLRQHLVFPAPYFWYGLRHVAHPFYRSCLGPQRLCSYTIFVEKRTARQPAHGFCIAAGGYGLVSGYAADAAAQTPGCT